MAALRLPTTIRPLALSPSFEPGNVVLRAHAARSFQALCSRASCSSARSGLPRSYGPMSGLRMDRTCQIKRVGAFSTSIIRRAKREETTTSQKKAQLVSHIVHKSSTLWAVHVCDLIGTVHDSTWRQISHVAPYIRAHHIRPSKRHHSSPRKTFF
jgi:hypothetical protein